MESDCIFCHLCTEKNKIKYENSNYVVFNDHRPAASFHLLVVPKVHCKNILSLDESQTNIITDMVEIGKNLLKDAGIDDNVYRMGFHWPPFNAISHLHLHVIAPEYELGFISRFIFKTNTFWFVSPEVAIERLQNKKKS